MWRVWRVSPVRPACAGRVVSAAGAVRVTSRGRGAGRRQRCPPQGRQVRPYRRRCPPQARKPRPYLRTCLPQEQQKPRPHPRTHLPYESTRWPAHPSTRRPGQASSWLRRTSHGFVFGPRRPGSSAGAVPPVRPLSPRSAWRGGRRARSPSARHRRCSTGATWTRSYATALRGRRSCDRSAPSTDAAAPQTPLSLSPPCSPVRSAAPGQRSGESSVPQVSAHFGVLLSLIVPDPPATERTPRRLHSGCEQHHETEDAVRTWGVGDLEGGGLGDLGTWRRTLVLGGARPRWASRLHSRHTAGQQAQDPRLASMAPHRRPLRAPHQPSVAGGRFEAAGFHERAVGLDLVVGLLDECRDAGVLADA